MDNRTEFTHNLLTFSNVESLNPRSLIFLDLIPQGQIKPLAVKVNWKFPVFFFTAMATVKTFDWNHSDKCQYDIISIIRRREKVLLLLSVIQTIKRKGEHAVFILTVDVHKTSLIVRVPYFSFSPTDSPLECNSPLIPDNNTGQCRPPCAWTSQSPLTQKVYYGVVVISLWLALIATIITFITWASIKSL